MVRAGGPDLAVRSLLVFRWWVQGAAITYVVGFAILGVLAYLTYAEQPPVPARVVDPSGEVLYTREDALGGMNVDVILSSVGGMVGTMQGTGSRSGPPKRSAGRISWQTHPPAIR